MAFRVQEKTLIERPREVVWAYVIAESDWQRPAVTHVRRLTGGPDGVGSRYEDTIRFAGRELTVVNEVLRFDPPGYLMWIEIDGNAPMRALQGSYVLANLDGKTQFTLTVDYQPRGFWRLASPVLRPFARRLRFAPMVRRLKEILESRP